MKRSDILQRYVVRGVRYADIPSVYNSFYRRGYSFEDIRKTYVKEDCTYTFSAVKAR